MNNFPVIRHIDQITSAISGHDEFVVKRDPKYKIAVANYTVNFSNTFPSLLDDGISNSELNRRMILRECRGITFDLDTGDIVSRKFHKFFNIGETEETDMSRIDLGSTHHILEKLDGSMITPIMVNSEIILCTKMGPTDVSRQPQRFIKDKVNYVKFMKDMIQSGNTPIFEWCSRENRIVIDYPTPRLVLIAIRDNVSGEYMDVQEMNRLAENYELDVVGQFNSDKDINKFVEYTKNLNDMEGFVIRFNNGKMVKVKGDWYSQIHKTISQIQLEKNVVYMILNNNIDDLRGSLQYDIVHALDRFSSDMHDNIQQLSKNVAWCVIEGYDNMSRKEFAQNVAPKWDQSIRGVLFQVWNIIDKGINDPNRLERESFNIIVDKIKQKCGSQSKLDQVKDMFNNINWKDYYVGVDLENS